MPPEPDSAEFTHLATRWLDGVASHEEIERLFTALHQSPACSRAFASMARFELLLEQTSREIDRESLVADAIAVRLVPHRRRLMAQRVLKVAAVIALLGTVLWFVRPDERGDVAETQPLPPTLQQRKPARLLAPPTPSSVAMAQVASTLPIKPLPEVLDDFFLTGVAFDKMSLQDAVHALESQLRVLNGGRRAELDRLRITLPADAARRQVTFHAGAISFLKALRALAGLADCEVDVSEHSVMLASHRVPDRHHMESRSVEAMLAQTVTGDSVDANTQLTELLADARALGMITEDAAGKVTGITGTRAQFDALAQMSESRAQVRALPPVQLLAFARTTTPNQNDHVLTSEEAERQRAQAAATTTGVQRIEVRPATDVLDPSAFGAAPGIGSPDIVIVAQPAGENQTQFTVFHPALVTPSVLANGDAREIAMTLAPGSGVVLNGLTGQQGGSLQLGYSQPPSGDGFRSEALNNSPSPKVAVVANSGGNDSGVNATHNLTTGSITITTSGASAFLLDAGSSLTLINASSASSATGTVVTPP